MINDDELMRITRDVYISINIKSELGKYINKAYENAGIDIHDPASCKNATWPTLNDLRELIAADYKDYSVIPALHDIDSSKDFMVIDLSNIPNESVDENIVNVFLTEIIGM